MFRGQFYQCDSHGTVLDSWEGLRVQGLAYRADGKILAAGNRYSSQAPGPGGWPAGQMARYRKQVTDTVARLRVQGLAYRTDGKILAAGNRCSQATRMNRPQNNDT